VSGSDEEAVSRLGPDVVSFLQEKRFAVLATINRNGSTQQSSMWYELQQDEILMNTKRGRVKDRNLRRDPRASVCIEDGYRYVTLRGWVALNADPAVAQPDIKRLSTRYHGPERAEEQMRDTFSKEERVTVRLRIERVKVYGFGD
jgi:PPOX class probable F420-dependent enzyme